MNLAVIPARGGSKRILKKNIKDFCGLPIISYSINAAIKSNLFDKIIVSTDDSEILEVAKNFGAEIPFLRPKNISDDHTGTLPVINHALGWFEERNIIYRNICCIYPCSPLLKPVNLIKSLDLMKTAKADSCLPVCKFLSNPARSLIINSEGRLEWKNSEFKSTRTQDLQEIYHDAGTFYWAKREKWLSGDILDGVPYELPNEDFVDIDNQDDWSRAEFLFEYRNSKK